VQSTQHVPASTDAPRVPLRRRIPGATLAKPGPRPTPPQQRLTARPIPRDLWDEHHAFRAFGDPA
jgi:hypothetical protein